MWSFRVRPGPQDPVRRPASYGGFAAESYDVFRRLRDEGVIPQDVRFQMSLPSPHSAIDGCFDDPQPVAGGVRRLPRRDPRRDPQDARGDPGRRPGHPVGRRAGVPRHGDGRQVVAAVLAEAHARGEVPAPRRAARRALAGDSRRRRSSASTGATGRGAAGRWPTLPDLGLCVRMSNEAKRRIGRRLD